MIASGVESAFICAECVDICLDIITEQNEIRTGKKWQAPVDKGRHLDLLSLGLSPLFKTTSAELRESHIFHLCPFKEPFDTIYRDHVVVAARAEGFSIDRADEIYGTGPVIEDIWRSILSATIVTADITGRNPNVMYEVGMAHTVGKAVVILAQSVDDIPFDLRHYRSILYSYTPRGCVELESRLCGTFRFVRAQADRATVAQSGALKS